MTVAKFSISVSEDTAQGAKELVKAGKFRSRSHLFDEGAKRIIEENRNV